MLEGMSKRNQDCTGEFDVGRRLRELRLAAGLSQRQLAQRAGVPHAQVSVVEHNKSSPSVATLRRILGGLNVSLADFFEVDRNMPEGPFFRDDQLLDLTSKLTAGTTASGNGSMALRQVGDARRHNLQVLHEVYEPGADTGETYLQHFSCEGGIIIEGELEVTVGDQARVLKAGDSYLFDSRVPHRFRNLSESRCVVVSACTPPYL